MLIDRWVRWVGLTILGLALAAGGYAALRGPADAADRASRWWTLWRELRREEPPATAAAAPHAHADGELHRGWDGEAAEAER